MKKSIISFSIFLLFLSCGKDILNDDLYIKISAETICSSLDDDTPIYQKYGVTEKEMMDYKEGFVHDETRRLAIAQRILSLSSQCLGNTNS